MIFFPILVLNYLCGLNYKLITLSIYCRKFDEIGCFYIHVSASVQMNLCDMIVPETRGREWFSMHSVFAVTNRYLHMNRNDAVDGIVK